MPPLHSHSHHFIPVFHLDYYNGLVRSFSFLFLSFFAAPPKSILCPEAGGIFPNPNRATPVCQQPSTGKALTFQPHWSCFHLRNIQRSCQPKASAFTGFSAREAVLPLACFLTTSSSSFRSQTLTFLERPPLRFPKKPCTSAWLRFVKVLDTIYNYSFI